ncbi:hypothetical protein NET02_16340, partial [Thermomicrobiaceae bacterium CFH 74404]
RLPADVSVVTTEQVGAVTVRVVTDGVQHAWELRGPDGSVLVESQPAPITAEQAEREAFVAASAAALRFGALGEEARHA